MVDERLDLSLGLLGGELREGSGLLLWLRNHRDGLRSTSGTQSLLETEDTQWDLGDLLQAGSGGGCGWLRSHHRDGVWEVEPLDYSTKNSG